MTGNDVVVCARDYIGTPHLHLGRLKGVAVDCAGLLLCVGKELNVVDENFDFVSYQERNDGSDLRRIIDMFCDEIETPEPGDIFIMNVFENPQHCGFYTDNGIIHSLDKVVEHSLVGPWPNRIVSSHRLKVLNGS